MLARISATILAVGFASLSGCGPAKLDVTKTLDLNTEDAKAILLDAQSKPQKINVEFEATNGTVYVLLFKDADVAKDEDGIVPANKALGSKANEKSGSFAVDVPENTATRVVVRNASGKTDVKVHVTNR